MRDLAERDNHLNNRINNLEAIIKTYMGIKTVPSPTKTDELSEVSLHQIDESKMEETQVDMNEFCQQLFHQNQMLQE